MFHLSMTIRQTDKTTGEQMDGQPLEKMRWRTYLKSTNKLSINQYQVTNYYFIDVSVGTSVGRNVRQACAKTACLGCL